MVGNPLYYAKGRSHSPLTQLSPTSTDGVCVSSNRALLHCRQRWITFLPDYFHCSSPFGCMHSVFFSSSPLDKSILHPRSSSDAFFICVNFLSCYGAFLPSTFFVLSSIEAVMPSGVIWRVALVSKPTSKRKRKKKWTRRKKIVCALAPRSLGESLHLFFFWLLLLTDLIKICNS